VPERSVGCNSRRQTADAGQSPTFASFHIRHRKSDYSFCEGFWFLGALGSRSFSIFLKGMSRSNNSRKGKKYSSNKILNNMEME
jgi:hypothetical protein